MDNKEIGKCGIYDDCGDKYVVKTFNTYEEAEWYMKEHKNVGLIPQDCEVLDENEIDWFNVEGR